MTQQLNNVKVGQLRVSRVPIDLTTDYNLGDNVKWDASRHCVTPVVAGDVASAASAALYVGVCLDVQPITSLNQNLPFGVVNLCTKGLVEFTVDDSATYYPGDYVTFGAGAQLIRKTAASAGNAIGVVAPENQALSVDDDGDVTGITAVANSTKLLIYIRPQFTLLTSW